MKINRYNLGFKWFGPLEQCDDGDLVLAKDVERLEDHAVELKLCLDERKSILDSAVDVITAKEEQIYELRKVLSIWRTTAFSIAICIALLAAILILKV